MSTDFNPFPYYIQGTLIATGANGKKMSNVLAFKGLAELPSYADCVAIGTMLHDWVTTDLWNTYSDSLAITQIHVRSMAEEPGPEYDLAVTDGVGSQAGDDLPMSQTMVVQLQTGLSGHSQVGRFNTFQSTEDMQTGGLYTGAYITTVESALAALQVLAGLEGYQWCVASRHLTTLYEIVAVIANGIPRTLRSRAVDHGI